MVNVRELLLAPLDVINSLAMAGRFIRHCSHNSYSFIIRHQL